MKYCQKCGKELVDEAVVCPGCGCSVNDVAVQANNVAPLEQEENPGLQRAAVICAFLVPIVGLICGIIGAIKYKTPKLKKQCIAAIPISIVVWIITALLLLSY